MKDGGHTVQSCRNSANCPFRYLAAQGANQRFNRRPAYVRLGRANEDGVQRGLLRFVHRERSGTFLVPSPLNYDSTFRYHSMCGDSGSWRRTPGNCNCARLNLGRRTGRSLPECASARFGGGKSELRRAVCRITSGMWVSRPTDGQCHRKDTASATPPRFFRIGRGRPWNTERVRLDGPVPVPR